MRCSPGSCREEMHGRARLRYGAKRVRGNAANVGGTTEVNAFRPILVGGKVFFYPIHYLYE